MSTAGQLNFEKLGEVLSERSKTEFWLWTLLNPPFVANIK